MSQTASLLPLLLGLPLGWLCTPSADPPESQASRDFANAWYDGRAELSGYDYTVRRYGEERSGEAVAIFVTEPFSRTRRVKLDDPEDEDAMTVLKLNLMRDFQTGIYDYDTMLSCFVAVEDFAPLKVSFTSAEWCGQSYEQLDVVEGGVQQIVHSYFEGESVEQTLERPKDGLLEDELFLWLRGLRGEPLAEGEVRKVTLLESPFVRRLEHRPALWVEARIERAAESVSVEVPAGSFEALRYTVRVGSRLGRFDVERDAPQRLLAWRWERDGVLQEEARLRGTERLRYWERNAEGQAEDRARLGLPASR